MSRRDTAGGATSDDIKQQPVQLSLCRSLFHQFHWKCFALTVLVDGCLAAIAWCKISTIAYSAVSLNVGHAVGISSSGGASGPTVGGSSGFFDGPRRTGVIGGSSGSLPLSSSTVVQSAVMTSSSYGHHSTFGACDDGYIYIPTAFVLMMYVVYLVECWHCRLRSELDERSDPVAVYDLIRRLTDSAPVVWWRAVCYHYVRRTRQVSRYRNGDAFTATQVYYERVNSHIGRAVYDHSQVGVRDISRRLVDLDKCPCARVRLTKRFSFATPDAELGYERQRATFFGDHERRDDYVETREGVDFEGVDDYRDRLIVFADPTRPPWYLSSVVYWVVSWHLSSVVYWVASVALLSWPLRVLVQYRTAYVHFYIHKVFGANGSTSSNDAPSGASSAILRMSTSIDNGILMTSLSSRVANGYGGVECYDYEGDDAAIESTIRTNSTLIPSYSEAMSMDRVGRDPVAVDVSSGRTRFFSGVDDGGVNRNGGSGRPLLGGSSATFGVARRTVYGSIVYRDDGRAFFRSEIPAEVLDSQRRWNRHRRTSGAVTDHTVPTTATTSTPVTSSTVADADRKRKRRRQSYHEAVSDPIGSRSSLSAFGRRRLNGGGARQLRRKSDVGVSGCGARSEISNGVSASMSLSAVAWQQSEMPGKNEVADSRSLRGTRSNSHTLLSSSNDDTRADHDSIDDPLRNATGSHDVIDDEADDDRDDHQRRSNATESPDVIGDDADDDRDDPQRRSNATATNSAHPSDIALSHQGPAEVPLPVRRLRSFDDVESQFLMDDDDDSPPPYEVALQMRVMRTAPLSAAVGGLLLSQPDYQQLTALDDSSSVSTVSTYLSMEPGEQQLTPRHRGWKHCGLPTSTSGAVAAFRLAGGSNRRGSAASRITDSIAMQSYHVETSL